MKKSLLFLCLGISSMLVFAGCNKEEPVVEEQVVESVLEENVEPEEVVEEPEEEVVETLVEEQNVEDDPYAPLIVSEEFAKEWKLLCLYRDGKLYSLCDIPIENCENYDCGWYQRDNLTFPTASRVHYLDGGDLNTAYILNCGPLMEFEYEAGDELRYYSEYGDEIHMFTESGYELLGYCGDIFAEEGAGGEDFVYKHYSGEGLQKAMSDWHANNFKMVDDAGNVYFEDAADFNDWLDMWYDNFYNEQFPEKTALRLEQGERYKCSWVDEDFNECWFSFTADYPVFKTEYDETAIHLTGTIDTNDKCYKYDLSSVPSGEYLIKGDSINGGGLGAISLFSISN